MNSNRASIIVLAYGAEPDLERCIDAILDDRAPNDELIVVDNGFNGGPDRLAKYEDRLQVVGDGTNLGFTGGCNLGAAESRGTTLVFVNSDAFVQNGSLAPLIAKAGDQTVGIACGCLRLADSPDLVNSAGNPIHYTGVTWAGHCGEPAALHSEEREVAIATGGFFAIRRAVWDRLGGFKDEYFAYHEDADLSLRAHLAGWKVMYVPRAVAMHNYEFGRNPNKMYLIERNRLMLVMTVFPGRVRRYSIPAIILTEPMFLALAVLQGWAKHKVRGWFWLIRHQKSIRATRRQVQKTTTLTDQQFADLLTDRITPSMVASPPGMGLINAVLARYWRWASSRLRRLA